MENRDAEHVRRQQVARELNALVAQAQRFRERVRERGLADAGHVLDQQVAAREQAGDAQAQVPRLADDDPFERLEDGLDQRRMGVGVARAARSVGVAMIEWSPKNAGRDTSLRINCEPVRTSTHCAPRATRAPRAARAAARAAGPAARTLQRARSPSRRSLRAHSRRNSDSPASLRLFARSSCVRLSCLPRRSRSLATSIRPASGTRMRIAPRSAVAAPRSEPFGGSNSIPLRPASFFR